MQKKDTPTRRKSSRGSKVARKMTDDLKPYRQQSERILAMLFDDEGTPPFIRDLLFEMLNELESETQVFWNHRQVAAVALPIMLQTAHAQGTDFFAERSEIFSAAAFNLRQQIENPYPPAETRDEYTRLYDELEADAAALSRILNSPRVPESIKGDLADTVIELVKHPVHDPAVLRVAYPLAVLDAMKKEKAEAEGSVGGE